MNEFDPFSDLDAVNRGKPSAGSAQPPPLNQVQSTQTNSNSMRQSGIANHRTLSHSPIRVDNTTFQPENGNSQLQGFDAFSGQSNSLDCFLPSTVSQPTHFSRPSNVQFDPFGPTPTIDPPFQQSYQSFSQQDHGFDPFVQPHSQSSSNLPPPAPSSGTSEQSLSQVPPNQGLIDLDFLSGGSSDGVAPSVPSGVPQDTHWGFPEVNAAPTSHSMDDISRLRAVYGLPNSVTREESMESIDEELMNAARKPPPLSVLTSRTSSGTTGTSGGSGRTLGKYSPHPPTEETKGDSRNPDTHAPVVQRPGGRYSYSGASHSPYPDFTGGQQLTTTVRTEDLNLPREGVLLGRLSVRSLLTTDWKPVFWILSDDHHRRALMPDEDPLSLLIYRSKSDYYDNPKGLMIKKEIPIKMNLSCIPIRRKEYKGYGQLHYFLLEENTELGTVPVAKFASDDRNDVDILWINLKTRINAARRKVCAD